MKTNTGGQLMKAKLAASIAYEYQKHIVSTTSETRLRARMKAAGWTFKSRAVRADGQVELGFERRKIGAAEVEA